MKIWKIVISRRYNCYKLERRRYMKCNELKFYFLQYLIYKYRDKL